MRKKDGEDQDGSILFQNYGAVPWNRKEEILDFLYFVGIFLGAAPAIALSIYCFHHPIYFRKFDPSGNFRAWSIPQRWIMLIAAILCFLIELFTWIVSKEYISSNRSAKWLLWR